MIQPINSITAVKVISFTGTTGSAPIKVLCDDGNMYYAKTMTSLILPLQELANEIICNYYASLWNLHVPTPALITIPDEIVTAYLSEPGVTLPERYIGITFNTSPFFGSQIINFPTEIEQYIGGLDNKNDYNKFASPLDLIKIGVFDMWLCNRDRKPDNPNVLISEIDSELVLHPIDHTAAFAYHTNLKAIKPVHMLLEDKFCLLSTNLSKNILNFAPRGNTCDLYLDILDNINSCINQSENVFSQVPNTWGFSKGARKNILTLLSDEDRNNNIAKSYFRFIPR